MSYITGANSIEKGKREELFFNKNQFLFATDFATDPYFEDELNWKRIALHYKDATNNQTQIVILKDMGSRGWYAPSETSRTGIWQLEFIEIYDKQGDVFRVERTNMPSPQDFDIDVQRKVAPASPVDLVQEEPELITNGTFDSDISSWVVSGTATHYTGFLVPPGIAVYNNSVASQIFSTVANKRYKVQADVDAVVADGGTQREPSSGSYFDDSGSNDFYWFVFSGNASIYWNHTQIVSGLSGTATQYNDGNGNIYYRGTLEKAGDLYRIYRETTVVADGDAQVQVLQNNPETVLADEDRTSADVLNFEFTATNSNSRIDLKARPTLDYVVYDNISVKAVPDKLDLAEDEGDYWQVGFKCKIWDDVAQAYLTNDIYEITDISEDQVTFDKQIIGDYQGKTLRLRFPDYTDVSGPQASLYQYVSQGY